MTELILLIFAIAYALPVVIAFGRRHPLRWPIAVTWAFLGWTLVAWVVCVAMAVSPTHMRCGYED